MKSKKCSLQEYDGEKHLYGTAAQLYKISSMGGWDSFCEKMTNDITKKVTNELVPIITKEIINELNKPVLKVIK